MAVKIGSARSSYGNTSAGDQNGGKEVSTQNYYVHSQDWVVLRAKDPEKREKIALAMEHGCDNDDIGYSQPDRLSLRNNVKDKEFDPALTTKKVNCDCSSLVRVCVNYAGIEVANFTTSNEASKLMATGEFVKYIDAEHCNSSKRLLRGDILNTKTKGHTVVVLTNGELAEHEDEYGDDVLIVREYELGKRVLRNGDEGTDVQELQSYLIQIGYSCGIWGADGEYGDSTELAVRAFQSAHNCEPDGEYGPNTHKAMLEALEEVGEGPVDPQVVAINGGNCYIRSEPNTKGKKLGIAHAGNRYNFGGSVSVDGWNQIEYKNGIGWVSGKYSKLV